MNEELKQLIAAYMHLAYEYGRWHGQVDLEISMDNNLGDAFAGAVSARKTGMPLHTVASGGDDSRPVRYFLRSDVWREGVVKSSQEGLNKAINTVISEVSA